MSNKKKILISLIIIIIINIGFIIYFKQSNETVLDTYVLNQQGLMKNDKVILDEKFDNKGNLIYYKYKSPDNSEILEFSFTYEYDEQNRITKINSDDNNFINIEYNDNNQISKIYENMVDVLINGNTISEYTCKYLENDEILVDKNITYNVDTENTYKQHSTLNFKTITNNNQNFILLTEKDDTNSLISERVYLKSSKNIDYSDFYNLLYIVPQGYTTEDSNITFSMTSGNQFFIEPIFYNGNIISLKNYIKTNQTSITEETNCYYDNMNRLLKLQSSGYEHNTTINCMYKSINSKEYYQYKLTKVASTTSTKFTYIENKIYLDNDNKICKKETILSDEIDENKYNSKLNKFERYFEKENIN